MAPKKTPAPATKLTKKPKKATDSKIVVKNGRLGGKAMVPAANVLEALDHPKMATYGGVALQQLIGHNPTGIMKDPNSYAAVVYMSALMLIAGGLTEEELSQVYTKMVLLIGGALSHNSPHPFAASGKLTN